MRSCPGSGQEVPCQIQMNIQLYQVDAFTNTAFAGNPAAVCLLPEPADGGWMQQVAAEMNLSETAFLLPQDQGFLLRWFTPAVEVDLCGHATLASAHVLWETGRLPHPAVARFYTRSGPLTAAWEDGFIKLDFPALAWEAAEISPELCAALGVSPRYVGRFGGRYLIEVESEAHVRALKPDFSALRRLPGRGIAVTSRAADPGFDFVSRYFAPWVGVNEDPVTGSAHCCLGPFWGERLGKQKLTACQVSARGGELRVVLEGERVQLGGQAVTVLSGQLHTPPPTHV